MDMDKLKKYKCLTVAVTGNLVHMYCNYCDKVIDYYPILTFARWLMLADNHLDTAEHKANIKYLKEES